MKKIHKSTIAMIVVVAMSFGICFNLFESSVSNIKDELPNLNSQEQIPAEERGALEAIANIVSDEDKDIKNMSDSELQAYVEKKTENFDVGQLSEPSEKNTISLDIDKHRDDYSELGELKKPFDQIYPELMDTDTVEYDEKTVLIKLSNEFDGKITSGMKKAGVMDVEKVFSMEKSSWYEAFLKKGVDITATVEMLRKVKSIQLVDFNYQIKTTAMDDYEEVDANLTSNKLVAHQWHLNYCGFGKGTKLLDNPGGSSNVVVAVIDTGVDYDHEDLADNIWINENEIPNNSRDDDQNGYVDDYYGVNVVANRGNGDDDNGHGTHVAGIIAAKNNHLGTVGIAYNTKIMPIKAAMASGYLNSSDVAEAINYAYEHGAEVINMSFGGNVTSIAVQDALSIAYTRCVLVASAGNDAIFNEGVNPSTPNYPAALSYVIGVMSVGRDGIESNFTNLDNTLYSGLEYEVYAPGEEILSTVPDNKYASWSGTSMSAPVVSAIAALLRSQYVDTNAYPSKFIYGQITATSNNEAVCPGHMKYSIYPDDHNVPFITNLHSALTELPKPDVGLSHYDVFDTVGLDNDLENRNNGDGVIEAGETVALGLTLRNRWGMSKNTSVTIDAKSLAGISDPYIEILNPTVDYGSIGTYSTGDCGKIYEKELFTGWENPFYIRISKDCPNDYIFQLNVNITCENAMDENDEKIYKPEEPISIRLTVRNGYILPSVIKEDMTLTPDNLYIIPNATTIREGVTVKVEPGTHIQFWSNDAEDPYSDNYVAYLRVEGDFLVEGTAEQPVYIYPSDLKRNYIVNFGEANGGYVSLKHADVTNYFYENSNTVSNKISYAENCVFTKSTGERLTYRYVTGGSVYEGNSMVLTLGHFTQAKECAFYKISFDNSTSSRIYGTFDACAFIDCGFNYSYNNQKSVFSNCVFYGNNFKSDYSNYNAKSSYAAYNPTISAIDPSQLEMIYREETGTTYISVSGVSYSDIKNYLKFFGFRSLVIETEEELKWLQGTNLSQNKYYDAGITQHYDGSFRWCDGTKVGDFIAQNVTDSRYTMLNLHFASISYDYGCDLLFEVPGEVYVSDILFDEYVVDLDVETNYVIKPLTLPVPFKSNELIFESSDKSVATVDKNGLVTPVSKGNVDIYVYSKDRAVKNHITINVVDYVPLEGIHFEEYVNEIAVGESFKLCCGFEPLNTTRKNVTYTSSDPDTISVNDKGVITAKGRGKAVITASCEGLADEITITAYNKADTLSFKEVGQVYFSSQGKAEFPEVDCGGADVSLTYKSSNEEVIAVNNDELIIKDSGVVIIRAIDEKSGLYADTIAYVTNENSLPKIKRLDGPYNNGTFALFDDGRVYDFKNQKVILEDVADMSIGMLSSGANTNFAFLNDDGSIMYGTSIAYLNTIDSLKDVVRVFAGSSTYFAVDKDGICYSWGNNANYCSGTGFVGKIDVPKMVNLENVVDVYSSSYSNSYTYFLTKDGSLYFAGGQNSISNPVLISKNVSGIEKYGLRNVYANINGEWYRLSTSFENNIDTVPSLSEDVDNENPEFTIKDGQVYDYYEKAYVPRINNVLKVYGIGTTDEYYIGKRTIYMISNDDVLYAYGSNYNGQINAQTSKKEYEYNEAVVVPAFEYDKDLLAVEKTNVVDGVLKDKELTVDFNGKLLNFAGELYADNKQIPYNINGQFDTMKISLTDGFKEGVNYKFVIAPNQVLCDYLPGFEDEFRIEFKYENDGTIDEEIDEVENPIVHETVFDDTVKRFYYTPEEFSEYANEIFAYYNPYFHNNVILNRFTTDTNVNNWMRIQAPTSSVYSEIPLGYNYWGTTNDKIIGLQIVDYTDFQTYSKVNYEPYLTTPPENTFPFVTDVKIFNEDGEEVTTVGNEEITVRVSFNRDMDESIPLSVCFGGSAPYNDYEVDGQYIDARTWEGKITISTLIPNGNQYFTISNGKAKGTALKFFVDDYRFGFEIDTSAAQALIMQGSATDEGIELSWMQDDFETLMGYNVYRSTSEDGYYQKINDVVIPAETKTFFDDTVEPGVVYYYNFTVVKTDLTESIPSGKISVMSKDTMAPNIYHVPVYTATEGSNIIISATVTDNLVINKATVYYRMVGADEWNMAVMNNLNDKYSAIINAKNVSIDGIEYYIDAFDGISHTYKGSSDNPYRIVVQEAIGEDNLGDVNGDGKITNLDALMLLQAINDVLNLSAEQFVRADLNGDGALAAAEALRILQYVSGVATSVKM